MLGLISGMSQAAPPYALPKDLPTRKPGLWESVLSGKRGPNEIEHIKRYCLDANADRALHEADILGRELSVIHEDISCRPPTFALTGKVLTAKLACRTNRPDDNEMAGEDFDWTTTFKNDREVVTEMHSASRETLIAGGEDMVKRQRWLGACEPGQKPGDVLDISLKSNGRPGFTNPPSNIFESVRVQKKLLKEAIEINRRLGPM